MADVCGLCSSVEKARANDGIADSSTNAENNYQQGLILDRDNKQRPFIEMRPLLGGTSTKLRIRGPLGWLAASALVDVPRDDGNSCTDVGYDKLPNIPEVKQQTGHPVLLGQSALHGSLIAAEIQAAGRRKASMDKAGDANREFMQSKPVGAKTVIV